MFGIQWDCLHNSIWFLILTGIVLIYVYGCYKIIALVKQLAHGRYDFLVKHFSMVKMIVRIICMLSACLALGLALLCPVKIKKNHQMKQEARNLFIALDVSRSMAAADCVPSRLMCAKEKIKNLVYDLKSDRVGLILFAGSAFVYCPLTTDYETFFQLLDSVDLKTISSTNTALDKPILCTLSAFEKSNATHKLLMLVTDGEDFGNNMEAAMCKADEHKLCICVLGVGSTEGAPIPIYDHDGKQIGHQKNKEQKVVISMLHESKLKKMAQGLGGIYHTISPDSRDVHAFVRFIQQRDKELCDTVAHESKEFYYNYFLLFALCMLLFEWFL